MPYKEIQPTNYRKPSPPPKQPCSHTLIHLDTKKYYNVSDFNTKFTRIDNFYCEKCGEIITKKKEEYSRNEPDWY